MGGVTSTEVGVWGAGISQTFDAAATTLYLGWRHYDPTITCNNATCAAPAASNPGGTPAAGVNFKLQAEGMDVVMGGARVTF